MDPSSAPTSAVVIVIALVSFLTPCKGKNSVKVSHPTLTHRRVPPATETDHNLTGIGLGYSKPGQSSTNDAELPEA